MASRQSRPLSLALKRFALLGLWYLTFPSLALGIPGVCLPFKFQDIGHAQNLGDKVLINSADYSCFHGCGN